jgi:hypothetical protein
VAIRTAAAKLEYRRARECIGKLLIFGPISETCEKA